jgi:ComF family protein
VFFDRLSNRWRVPTLQALKKEAGTAWSRRPWRWESDCRFCGAPGAEACAGCLEALPHVAAPCPRCALPSGTGETCGECLARARPFDAAHACFAYRFPVDRAMQRFKFAGDLAAGRWLAEQLAEDVAASPRPDFIVSPPSTRERLATRGFDPARVIARHVARRVGARLDTRVLRRRRETAHQPGLGREARQRNLREAFECRVPLPGAHVAIVDDVMTTGATAEAVARALRCAGAARIEVWVVARTPEPGSA